MYGFHGWPELYSLEVGRAIKKNPPAGVQTLHYRPKALSEELMYHELSKSDQLKESRAGRAELRKYLKERYADKFVIDLHDTSCPFDDKKCAPKTRSPQFEIYYPSWNERLGSIVWNYVRERTASGMRVDAASIHPRIGYHAAVLEFFPIVVGRNSEMLYLSKSEGMEFVKDFAQVIMKRYLGKEA